MGYRLKLYFDNGDVELVDEIFDTEEDAKDELEEWLDSWNEGKETLQLAGEDYVDADIEDWEIYKE